MEKKTYLNKILLSTCVYYTAVTFLVLFFYFIINADLSGGMHPVSLILFLPFSLCFAVANTIFQHSNFHGALKVALHYILTIGGAWLFLFLPNKNPQQQLSGALILFLVLSVIYVCIMAVILFFRGRMRRLKTDSSTYTGVYKNNQE